MTQYRQLASFACFLLGILLSTGTVTAGEIQIYIDGCPTSFTVPDELEMYELEPVLILEDNRDLLQEFCIQYPQHAVIGVGNQSWDRDIESADDYFGEREIQPYLRDIRYREYLSSEEWHGVWGDISYPGRMRLDLDHSGPGWSFDGTFMNFEGISIGPDGNDDEELLVRGHKQRSQANFRLRSGGMDGGTQFLNAQWYEVNRDDMPFQVVDIEHLRIGTGFRMLECPGMLQAEVFSGYYKSDRQNMDNQYLGASLDGSIYISDEAMLSSAASVTEIDAKLQEGSSSRTETATEFSYDLSDDLQLRAGVEGYSDNSDISSVSDSRHYNERSVGLHYHPSGKSDMSLSLSRREVHYQRMGWENEDLYALNLRDPEIDRGELAIFRVAENADYDSLRFRSNFRLDSCSRLSADFRQDDYGRLPESGDASSLSLMPSYLASQRQWSSIFYERQMSGGGRLELVASESQRDNELRDSHFSSCRYSLGYGNDLNNCNRWMATISRSETDLDGSGIDIAWDSETTSYGLDFSGYGNWSAYRFSLGHHVRDGSASGDYSSAGLELDLNDSPLVLNTWWREQQAGRQALISNNDIGLSVGWRIDF